MKKGFTLVEVIAVITILAVILLLVTPKVLDSLKESKEKAYQRQVKSIEEAAERWAIDHKNEVKDAYFLELGDLSDDGYLESEDIIDPRTNKEISTYGHCIVIMYDDSNNQYDYTFTNSSCYSLKADYENSN